MPKATYKTLAGKLLVEIEFDDTKTLIENVAAVQEVCEQEKCSNCGNTENFRFVVRTVGDDRYHELMCRKCGYKLGFGIPKKGKPNLYPRRRNQKTKEPIGPKKDGWHKFDPNDIAEEE